MGEANILEQQCMEIMHNTIYPSLSDGEKERLLVLVAHDLAMGAKESRSRWVNDLLTLDSALLNEQGAYSMLGKNTRTDSFDLAVRHNSMAITASIREDFVAGTHPGAIIFPLLMAETERSSKNAEEFLTAAAIGLKLAILLNSVFGKALAQKGYRATTVVGAMAGAASLSMLRGYSLSEAMKAMSVAASTGLGFAFSFLDGAEEWIVQASLASQLANLACLNAKSLHFAQDKFLTGERSLSHLLECEVCRNPQTVDLSLVNIGVKRHPVNSFVQPVVEAVLRLPQVNVSDIDSIVVSVPESFSSMSMLSLTGPYPRPNLALVKHSVKCCTCPVQSRDSIR